jgi:hypothetical protein
VEEDPLPGIIIVINFSRFAEIPIPTRLVIATIIRLQRALLRESTALKGANANIAMTMPGLKQQTKTRGKGGNQHATTDPRPAMHATKSA